MPKITVDGQTIECKDRQMIIQACQDAGIEIPHYCYHPGLSIVASCRICLVEVEGIPKLVPACQTPIRDGMVVHAKSSKAIANQKQVMEYLLVNHPLDCPVCDQAGECYLQDYSYQFGRSLSRFEEDKAKKPKKDVGKNILLYNDRCIMCTRCVRFTREISGTSELYVDGRGHKEEIDVFPGKPLDNKLSGNVADICPVGALLDKDFLFKQRVWLLKNTPSVSPVDSGGENIHLAHNEGKVWRIKPRYNADVNQWWISDDTRYAFHALGDERRLKYAMKKHLGALAPTQFVSAVETAVAELRNTVATKGPGSLYAVLSPMLSCEEAWLLGRFIRSLDPRAVLVVGPVPTAGENEVFKNSVTGKQTFVIQAEKVPNHAGVKRVLETLGGPRFSFAELQEGRAVELMGLSAGWITGGYLSSWMPAGAKLPGGFKVVQDTLDSGLAQSADVVLPSAFWAEKDGCWENFAGKIQAFAMAVPAPDDAVAEGQVFHKLLGNAGNFDAARTRGEMGEPFASVASPHHRDAEPVPAFEFAEL
jgi:NADH-quinone oxidoreductase subunit G